MKAVSKGNKLVRSRQVGPAGPACLFGGLYFGTEDKPKAALYRRWWDRLGKLDPYRYRAEKKEVRQAINKAINREELLKVLYKGRATYTYVVHGYYPTCPAGTPPGRSASRRCTARRQAAKRLLARPGIPKVLRSKPGSSPLPGRRSSFP